MTTEQQLPEGWKKTTLGEIATYVNGRAFKPIEWSKTGIPIVRIQNLNNPNAEYNYYDGNIEEKYHIRNGDLLFAWSASLGAYIWKGKYAFLNQHIFKVLPKENIDKTFIYYLLDKVTNELYAKAHGSGMVHVTKGKFEATSVNIPPFETQQTIVNKIESLFDEIDEGIGRLKTAAQQIQQYRQSLLKNAFNGELTKEWRSKHADALPSENELLAQIQTTREQHHAQQLADWQTAVSQWEQNGKEGKKPSKPSTLKKLESIEKLNEIELTELPDGWFWERLGLMTLGVEYGTSAKSQPEGKVPVLRMGNMQNGKIDWTDLVYSDNDEEIKQYLLKKGDVLFNRTNSPELVGKTSIIETDEKAIFAGYLIRINHLTEITDGRYLTYFLNSMIAKKYGNFVKTDGVNQSNINGQKLINYPFVFCSLKEQKEIADILEQKFTACDQLADEIAKQLKQAELLKQAVLKAAFSGSLLDK
ncbi:restriction endonuclease subunit S [Neisseria sicca]|uniref:Type I restriction modification DNA specificity domain protein n=1 Tax=Neisseria sicca VK64 TaxID=1095748 RepID=I2NVS3_NEISI|nr:restriction endonuclease subunit S [Neisseria sicca]EIG29934.1 type I restriction modification DNA specificity domain protein [Neisseria sicca VK64]